MLQNTIAAIALSQAQQRQQQDKFAQQQLSGNYGLDHNGHAVSESQRKGWNDRLTEFRNQQGPATSQNLFDSIHGNRPSPTVYNESLGGQDGFQDNVGTGKNLTAAGGYLDPSQPGWRGYLGTSINDWGIGVRNDVTNGVGAFSSIANKGLNSRYGATDIGRSLNGALGRPQATGYDINEGWNDDMDRGGMGYNDDNDGFSGDATGGMGANSGGVGGSRW